MDILDMESKVLANPDLYEGEWDELGNFIGFKVLIKDDLTEDVNE